jgi:glycosyltransferase involved in cell wall biosynthesis
MRIGVVTTSFPIGASDPTGRFVYTRVLALANAGHDVEVICARHDAGDDERGHARVRVTRIDAGARALFGGPGAPEVIEAARGRQRFAVWAAAANFFGALMVEVRRRAVYWDFAESHWLVPCGLATTLAAAHVAHRAHAHSGDVAGLEQWPGGRLVARTIVTQAREVVCVSHDLRTRFLALVGARARAGGRVRVASMPVGDDFAAAAEKAPSGCAPDGRRSVLGVGRLVPIKGFDGAILALGRLPRQTRPRLVLLGEGPERARLVALARACHVELHAPGVVSPVEVARWMSMAVVAIVPSRTLPGGRTEGSPLAAREAMACGVPVVASAVGGLADLRGTPGLTLVPDPGPATLAAAVDRALRTPAAGKTDASTNVNRIDAPA